MCFVILQIAMNANYIVRCVNLDLIRNTQRHFAMQCIPQNILSLAGCVKQKDGSEKHISSWMIFKSLTWQKRFKNLVWDGEFNTHTNYNLCFGTGLYVVASLSFI